MRTEEETRAYQDRVLQLLHTSPVPGPRPSPYDLLDELKRRGLWRWTFAQKVCHLRGVLPESHRVKLDELGFDYTMDAEEREIYNVIGNNLTEWKSTADGVEDQVVTMLELADEEAILEFEDAADLRRICDGWRASRGNSTAGTRRVSQFQDNDLLMNLLPTPSSRDAIDKRSNRRSCWRGRIGRCFGCECID